MAERGAGLDRAWALALLAAMATIPLLWPQVPPFTDVPGHMGRYFIQTHNDEIPSLAAAYRFEWRLLGNLGIDLLIVPMSKLFGVELGTKLIVLAIPALTVIGMLWTAREAAGRVPPAALFALPLAYSYPLHFGFANFALSVALAFNLLALWIRLGRKGAIGPRTLIFIPLSCLLWLCHMVGWGLLGVSAFGTDLVRRRRLGEDWTRSVLMAGLVCAPLALPILPTLLIGQANDALSGDWFNLRAKAGWLFSIMRDRWRVFDMLSAIVLFGLLAFATLGRRLTFDWLLAAPAALVFLAFLCTPFLLVGSAYADMRMAPFLIALGLLAIRGVHPAADRWLLWGGLAFFIVRIAANTTSLALYDASYRAELQALNHIPRGASVLALVSRDCNDAWYQSRLEHVPAVAIWRRAAFINDQWTIDSASGLTIIKPDVGDYGSDPSQMVYPLRCRGWGSDVDTAMREFSRDAFDYVWIIRLKANGAPDLEPVWSNGHSMLYRVIR